MVEADNKPNIWHRDIPGTTWLRGKGRFVGGFLAVACLALCSIIVGSAFYYGWYVKAAAVLGSQAWMPVLAGLNLAALCLMALICRATFRGRTNLLAFMGGLMGVFIFPTGSPHDSLRQILVMKVVLTIAMIGLGLVVLLLPRALGNKTEPQGDRVDEPS